MNLKPILQAILEDYALPLGDDHGVTHWARVLENGRKLAEATGANVEVVSLFAVLHDSRRINEVTDPDGVTYRYSGTVNVGIPWTPTLLEIKEKIEAVQGQYNYCLLNRYRSGQDSMGMHADDEPEMGNVIGSLSLGATRTFRIKHNKSKETMSFSLGHGSLIIMAGTMQKFWKHEIPKTKQPVEERINLTYRQIVEAA